MRWAWIIGGVYTLVGGSLLFCALHPLRDLLDDHAFQLLVIGTTHQAIQGLALLVIAQSGTARIAAILIALGTAVSCVRLYALIFAGFQPFLVIMPLGGLVTALGWIALILSRPGGRA